MGTDRFSWLHLTDLHFGLKGQGSLWSNLREAFFTDLPKLHELSGPWDAVFFTGDLVQSGAPGQFEEMHREVIDRLWGELAKLGSGNAVLLAVPGNHDLLRPDEKKDDAAIDALLKPSRFTEISNKFWDNPEGSYRRVINEAFTAYRAWFDSAPQRPKAGLATSNFPGDFAYTLQCGGRQIGIVGLNTTFLQLKGGDYQRQLVWDARQIHQVCGGAIDDWIKRHHVCLLLTHQGPDWLTAEAEAHGETEIAPAGRFAVHLFGHMHETKILYIKTGGGEAVRRCQCRSVFGMEQFGEPPKTERSHGYAAGAIGFRGDAASLQLWPRIATRETGPWRFVPDYQHAELGEDQATSPDKVAARNLGNEKQPERLRAELAGRTKARSSLVAIPKSTWPADLTAKGFEMPDSMLLRPESRVVRFHHLREPLRDEIVGWALDPSEFVKLRLQAGEGGSGKSRLLIEVCDKLETVHGWHAGFLDSSQSIETGLPSLLTEDKQCLIVLDYAESRTNEIVKLVRTALDTKNAQKLRLVLLAREGGDWWDRIGDAAKSDQAVSAILRGLNTKTGPYRMGQESIPLEERNSVFDEAVRDFSRCKGEVVPAAPLADLSDSAFGNPLFIHLAALATLRGQPGLGDTELLKMALGHERSYWRQLLLSEGLPEALLTGFEQAIALLTLWNGKRTAKEAKDLLARVPRLRDNEPSARTRLFDNLRRLYPMEGGLAGLQPDVLGETLVSEAFAEDDELLDVALGGENSREDVRSALTVLTRLGRRVPTEQRWLRRGLERHLTKTSEDALYVGMETGSPMPEIHAQVIKEAEPLERRRAVDLLRVKLPAETLNLKDLSIEIKSQFVAFLENKKAGRGAKHEIALCDAMSSLSFSLDNKGLLKEAADASEEAVRHARTVFRSNSERDRRRLAALVGNLGSRLHNIGHFSEALAAAREAEGIFRPLAQQQPSIYTADWAAALANLGDELRAVGRFEEALKTVGEAERLQRRLAQQRPDGYIAPWATSLVSLSNHLSAMRRFEDSLKAASEAEGLWCKLAQQQPDTYTAEWATSLGNLANHLRNVGRFEEALKVVSEAEVRRRKLAQQQPDAYTADWARSVANLANPLSSVGRFDESLEAARKGEGLWRELARRQPDAYTSDWARSLVNFSDALTQVGRFEEALEAASEAESHWRKLAERLPDAHTADWAGSLANFSNALSDVGRLEEAFAVASETEGLWRKLMQQQPDVYAAEWAAALGNRANRLSELGRLEEGLEAAREVERIRRQLAQQQPDTYKSDWATTLVNLANHLRDVGRFGEALEAAEKAENISRQLAQQQPQAYTAKWAGSLANLGTHLCSEKRFEEGLKAAADAEGLWRGLVQRQHDAHIADWAQSLGNLAEAQSLTGQFDIAIETAKESLLEIEPLSRHYQFVYAPWVGFARRIMAECWFNLRNFDDACTDALAATEIWNQIAVTRPNYESIQVAKSYKILMKCYIATAQNNLALETLGNAFEILRKPLADNVKPLKSVILEMIDLGVEVDPSTIERVVPNALLLAIKSA